MLKNIIESKTEVYTEYRLEFTDKKGNGFSFPCDEDGNVPELVPEAANNLTWCIDHPEKFDIYKEIVAYERYEKEPARGICTCGHEVVLYDVYYGACQCDKCGRWYNLFGQELIAPEYWEKDLYEEEYW